MKSVDSTTAAQCTRSCATYTSDSCPQDSDALCQINTGRCVPKCTKLSNKDACASEQLCEWDAVRGMCEDKECEVFEDMAVCESHKNCVVNMVGGKKVCARPCESYADEHGCALYPDSCYFKKTGSVSDIGCHTICQALSTADKCRNTKDRCTWTGKKCSEPCNKIEAEAMCTDACEWVASQGCSTACTELTTSECALSYCTKNTANGNCESALCTSGNEVICTGDRRCDFADSKCRKKSTCAFATDSGCQSTNECLLTIDGTCRQNRCAGKSGTCTNADGVKCIQTQCPNTNTSCCTEAPCTGVDPKMCDAVACEFLGKECVVRSKDCIYSDYVPARNCSGSCSVFTRLQTRTVIREAVDGGKPCDLTTLELEDSCSNTTVECTCDKATDASSCGLLSTCIWESGECKSSKQPLCVATGTGDCPAGCVQIRKGVCLPEGVQCSAAGGTCSADCEAQTPTDADVTYTLGSNPVTIFAAQDIHLDDGMQYPAATVQISPKSYINGADILILTDTTDCRSKFNPNKGVLLILAGTAAQLVSCIQRVEFASTATDKKQRHISWVVGRDRVHDSNSSSVYEYIDRSGTTWGEARDLCASTAHTFAGVQGHPATITSAHENTVVASLGAIGWIGASDEVSEGDWQWVVGPESIFFRGVGTKGDTTMGFSQWEGASDKTPTGKPDNRNGADFAIIQLNSYWTDGRLPSQSSGFVCEWNVPTRNTNSPYGHVVVAFGGCVPKTVCKSLTSAACSKHAECTMTGGTCEASCETSISLETCGKGEQANKCKWQTETFPHKCVSCSGDCKVVFGCEAHSSELACTKDPECEYISGKCKKKSCKQYNDKNKQCVTEACQALCATDATCTYNDEISTCEDDLCSSIVDQATCDAASTQCTRNTKSMPSSLTYDGTVTNNIVQTKDSDIPADVRNVQIRGATVMIIEGFSRGDTLSVTAPNSIVVQYEASFGLLRIIGDATVSDYITVLRTLRFTSTSKSDQMRKVTWSLSQAVNVNNPTATGDARLLVFYDDYGATHSEAAARCKRETIFGIEGQLASIRSSIETALLSRISGQQAWLGGSGTTSEWKWSDGSPFWTTGKGTTTAYNAWDSAEPAVAQSTTEYLMVTFDGVWRTKSNDNPDASGEYCEYLVPSSVAYWTGAQTIEFTACRLRPCQHEPELCAQDTLCALDKATNKCGINACAEKDKPGCVLASSQCYWHDSRSKCLALTTANANGTTTEINCAVFNDDLAKCAEQRQCAVGPLTSNGTRSCVTSCTSLPVGSACSARDDCLWSEASGLCAPKLCGADNEDACIVDPSCEWSLVLSQCQLGVCSRQYTQSSCTNIANNQCQWSANVCVTNICPWNDEMLCNADNNCLWDSTSGKCAPNHCTDLTKSECEKHSSCTFVNDICINAACAKYTTQALCEGSTITYDGNNTAKTCVWKSASNTTGAMCVTAGLDDLQLLGAAATSDCPEIDGSKDFTFVGVGIGILAAALLAAFAFLWIRQHGQPKLHERMTVEEDKGQDLDDNLEQTLLTGTTSDPPTPKVLPRTTSSMVPSPSKPIHTRSATTVGHKPSKPSPKPQGVSATMSVRPPSSNPVDEKTTAEHTDNEHAELLDHL